MYMYKLAFTSSLNGIDDGIPSLLFDHTHHPAGAKILHTPPHLTKTHTHITHTQIMHRSSLYITTTTHQLLPTYLPSLSLSLSLSLSHNITNLTLTLGTTEVSSFTTLYIVATHIHYTSHITQCSTSTEFRNFQNVHYTCFHNATTQICQEQRRGCTVGFVENRRETTSQRRGLGTTVVG
jgi:hypothetical protein